MAGRKGKRGSRNRKRNLRRFVLPAFLLAIILFFLFMYVQARTVTVRYASAVIPDLPASFDGLKLLHITDIDMMGTNDLSSQRRLFRKLGSIHPDIVLLGGNYTSVSFLQKLLGRADTTGHEDRPALFGYIADLSPSIGCYAISGDNDGPTDLLSEQLREKGIRYIEGELLPVSRNGEVIYLAGIDPEQRVLTLAESSVKSGDCVIGLMHAPSRYAESFIRESMDGGFWADLLLAGHTLGGQIMIGARSVFTLGEFDKRYLKGWTNETVPFLVSQGLGCLGVNLRFHSTPEVWVIELHSN